MPGNIRTAAMLQDLCAMTGMAATLLVNLVQTWKTMSSLSVFHDIPGTLWTKTIRLIQPQSLQERFHHLRVPSTIQCLSSGEGLQELWLPVHW
jgi:hypothetical protein